MQQRAALSGATIERRAVAHLLAEHLFAAKTLQWAAIKQYWAERRKCFDSQRAVYDAGPHSIAHADCTAIRERYTGVGEKKILEADVAMAAAEVDPALTANGV